jgi:hypothetical protein
VISKIAAVLVLLACGCNHQQKLQVQYLPPPDYPLAARFKNLQGTVAIRVDIGTDGRVSFAKGAGAPDILVKSAEANAKQWVFGPLPSSAVFPIEQSIAFVYKLEGKPMVVAVNPTIQTSLPDRVEISATPLVSDY